jgi:hypothetical protein
VLADTVVRCAIQHTFRQVLTEQPYGLPSTVCEEVFDQAARHLDLYTGHGPLEVGSIDVQRLASYSSTWIWREDHPHDVFGQAFREIVHQNYGESLCTPMDSELGLLRAGAQLLHELLPNLAVSALDHTYVVALFPPVGNWRGRASGSQFRVSGAIFLSREVLHNPWWVAEHLLHESLHQKLYDFRHGHTLLTQDSMSVSELLAAESMPAEMPRAGIVSPWNVPGLEQLDFWDTHRALAAFHVYVHLGMLCSLAEQRASKLAELYGALDENPPS